MESYVEVTFIHNLLIHSFSLTLSNVFSRKVMSKQHFLTILFMTTTLPCFLFVESKTWIWINEIFLFLFLFKNRNHTYLIFVGFRFLFHLFYYFFFEGTIYQLQFFVFNSKQVLFFDSLLLILYISVCCKLKYVFSEKDFVVKFKLKDKKYNGYLDSGNLATYQNIPIIFINEKIYESINDKMIYFNIQTISQCNKIEGKYTQIEMNHKKINVICAPMNHEYQYDAILNMKGIL